MNWKNILIVLILAIIVGGGAWWLATKYKPPTIEQAKDEITVLLTDLKTETGVNFSDIKDVEIKWRLKEGEEIIQGKGFEANRISDEEFRNIGFFFRDREFEPDIYNIANGTVSGLAGYRKDLIVCHYIAGATGYKQATGQWIPPEPELKDVEVKCAKTEETKATQTIETKKGQEFSIILEANPTTGYEWQLDFDSDYLELVDRKYVSEAPEEILGAGGKETFKFKALQSGTTEIIFSYLRSWETKPPIKEKIYPINIE